MMRRGLLSALLAGSLLAGCSELIDGPDPSKSFTSWARIAPAEVPVVFAPNATPSIVQARKRSLGRTYASYVMVFANPTTLTGENRMLMDVEFAPATYIALLRRPDRPFQFPLYTEESLRRTFASEFPGMPIVIADTPRTNRYGNYDLAFSVKGQTTCVLAWQLIDDTARILPETIASVHMEWRMCGPGISPEPLLAAFDKLTLVVSEDVLEPKRADSPADATIRTPSASSAH
jgi:hypothetical protein